MMICKNHLSYYYCQKLRWCFNFLTTVEVVIFFTVLLLYYVISFYVKVSKYPPGPTPLPFIGNLTEFLNFKTHWVLKVSELSKIYGPIITVWMGPKPVVFICDPELQNTAFNKPEFCGRIDSNIVKLFSNDKRRDIAFTDDSPVWSSLRKVGFATIRKYASAEHSSIIIDDTLVETLDAITNQQGDSKTFSADSLAINLFAKLSGTVIFSQKFDIDGDEVKNVKYFLEQTTKLFVLDFIPFVKTVLSFQIHSLDRKYQDCLDYVKNIFTTNELSFDEQHERNFCDFLVNAKREAIKYEKTSAKFLTDDNLASSLFDLYLGAVETTQTTFKWMILIISLNPVILQKLKDEIKTVLGDRMPLPNDQKKMSYTMAFIHEVLRYRNVLPMGIFHRTMITSKLGDYWIPKDTIVTGHQYSILLNEKYWDHPDTFNPDRFLNENGEVTITDPLAFCPFGIGRRRCVGEKLAMSNTFMVLVRFIQLTDGYELILKRGDKGSFDLQPDPGFPLIVKPKNFELILKK